MKNALTLLAALAIADTASAQSISIEDLQSQIAAELAQSNQYGELLNNPDPAQSLVAMKVMLRSGDPILIDLALDYGLYSPNPEVQYLALKGYFDSGPVIQVRFDGTGADAADFQATMKGRYQSAVAPDNSGIWTVRVGAFNEENSCYMLRTSTSICLILHTDNGTMIYTNSKWSQLALSDEAMLVGSVDIDRVGNVPVRIPIN